MILAGTRVGEGSGRASGRRQELVPQAAETTGARDCGSGRSGGLLPGELQSWGGRGTVLPHRAFAHSQHTGTAEGSRKLQLSRFSRASNVIWILTLSFWQLPPKDSVAKIKMGACFPNSLGQKGPTRGSCRGKSRISAVGVRTLWPLPDREAGWSTSTRARPTGLEGPAEGVARLGSEPPDTQQT